MWCVVVLLALLGVGAAVGRSLFVVDFVARAEPYRQQLFESLRIAIGVSTVRVVGAMLDVALTPAGLRPRDIFGLSLWLGWVITLGAAEVWIWYPRPPYSSRSIL